MYFAIVVLLLFVLPAISVAAESILSRDSLSVLFLIGKWLVFWAVGIRLFIAGLRQVFQPRFTAEEIFGIRDRAAFAIVREVGFGNLAMGALGIASLFQVIWLIPAAIVGGLYYGLAGLGHIPAKNKNAKENTAMVSDLAVFLVLLMFLTWSLR